MRHTSTDIDSEYGLLGSIIIDPSAMDDVSFLKPEHFYLEKNRWLFEAINGLVDNAREIDFLTITSYLKNRDGHNGKTRLEEIGGESFIVGLINWSATSVHAKSYAKNILDSYIRRRKIALAEELANKAIDHDQPVQTVLAYVRETLLDIESQLLRENTKTIKDYTRTVLDEILESSQNGGKTNGLPTGFADLDRLTSGLQAGELTILAARPSMGKTAMMLSIANHIAKQGKRGAIFSIEMTGERILRRIISSETQIELDRLKKGIIYEGEDVKLMRKCGQVSEYNLYIAGPEINSLGSITQECYRLYEDGLDVVFIDYLGLVHYDGNNRSLNQTQRVGEVTRSIKQVARSLNIPILCLCQLSRSVEMRGDRQPQLSDLRDSGNIEEHADNVMFLYRDDYYNKNTERPNIAELSVAKQRDGDLGIVELYWSGKNQTFFNLQRR